jgi:hypothetical protein
MFATIIRCLSYSGYVRGGKVASALALNPELPSGTLHSLVIADVTPFNFPISPDFRRYLEAMKAVEAANIPDAKSAQKILAERDIVRNEPYSQLLHLPFEKGSST